LRRSDGCKRSQRKAQAPEKETVTTHHLRPPKKVPHCTWSKSRLELKIRLQQSSQNLTKWRISGCSCSVTGKLEAALTFSDF
jgi:hypothetical protein